MTGCKLFLRFVKINLEMSYILVYLCDQIQTITKMNLFEIASAGLGTVHSLYLLLLSVDSKSPEIIQAKVKEYMNRIKGELNNRKEVEEMITWIVDDKFMKETSTLNRNIRTSFIYTQELEKLKDKMINFYLQKLEEILSENSEITRSCDIHTTMGNYVLQIMRLRMVIEPEINLLTNPHISNSATGEKIIYLTAKAFWMGDDGKKVRKFTKSLGKMSDYPGQRIGSAAKEESVRRIQPMLWDEYKATYPD